MKGWMASFWWPPLISCSSSSLPCPGLSCSLQDLDGFILVAHEGINGSICGRRGEVDTLFEWLEADARLAGTRRNYTPAEDLRDSHSHSHSNALSQHRSASPGRSPAHPDEPFRWEGVRVRHKAEVCTSAWLLCTCWNDLLPCWTDLHMATSHMWIRSFSMLDRSAHG